jgi:hypothetical protein
MTDDSFRTVLHEWARQQLENRSQHSGPFTITEVRIEHSSGIQTEVTFENDETLVYISFTHNGCTLYGDPCEEVCWSAPNSESTAKILNELLAIADQSA